MGNWIKLYLSFAVLLTVISCKQNSSRTKQYYNIQGFAQGSTFSISYSCNECEYDVKKAIDSVLKAFDASLSNYSPTSIISRINKKDTLVELDDWFLRFYRDSKLAYDMTDGAFDITVAPIVNYWGFGYESLPLADSATLDSLKNLVGMAKVELRSNALYLPDGMSIISNAIAQGLSVDVMCEFFDSIGIDDYLVEIGGELRTKGLNNNGDIWSVGIDKPIDTLTQRELQVAIRLENKALATSGNYRKFYEKDGVKYSHTIDPRTGYPVRHSLLSATVIASSCSMADAFATACMVQGLEWSKELAKNDSSIDVLLIYNGAGNMLETYVSDGFPVSLLNE